MGTTLLGCVGRMLKAKYAYLRRTGAPGPLPVGLGHRYGLKPGVGKSSNGDLRPGIIRNLNRRSISRIPSEKNQSRTPIVGPLETATRGKWPIRVKGKLQYPSTKDSLGEDLFFRKMKASLSGLSPPPVPRYALGTVALPF